MKPATECQACTAPTDLYLCSRCTGELKRMFRGLVQGPYITAVAGQTKSGGSWMIERRTPGLLEHLAEAAIGQVRISEGGGKRSRATGLVKYTDPKPATDGLGGTEGQRRLEQDSDDGRFDITSVLRQGGLNPKAVALLTETHRTLCDCVDELAFNGVIPPAHFAATPRESLPASFRMAEWLTRQMSALPLIDTVGMVYTKIDAITRRIERAIDRPEPPRTCGPCPTIIGHNRQECATALEARHGQTEVTCPACHQTYNTEQLITRTFNALHYKTFTIRELVDTVLPRAQEPVPRRTLYDWVAKGKLKARGESNGQPTYLLADVRRLRATSKQRAA